VAQVNLALVKGCALANATGILPRDGMLYFFVEKGSLQMKPEEYMPDANDLANFFLQLVQCCVVHYDGSSSDEWPLSSVHVDARKAFRRRCHTWAYPAKALPGLTQSGRTPAQCQRLTCH
jgi:hypothetical protein